MRPWLVYTLVNLVSFLSLVAIGFGVGIGISSGCKFENQCEKKLNRFIFSFIKFKKIPNFTVTIVRKPTIALKVKILFALITNAYVRPITILMD